MTTLTPRRRLAGAAGALVLSVAALGGPIGSASAEQPEPCAKQQTQVDKAQAAYDRVQAVFAKQQTKVKKAKKDVSKADSRAERKAAKKDLKQAKAKRDEVKSNKRGQQMRLAKKQERLEKCQAAQPEPEPGALVELVDRSDRFLGHGFFNPASDIRVRLISRGRRSDLARHATHAQAGFHPARRHAHPAGSGAHDDRGGGNGV